MKECLDCGKEKLSKNGNLCRQCTNKHLMVVRIDVTCRCGKVFSVSEKRIKSGRGKNCSKKCYVDSMVGKQSPYLNNLGRVPWNKDKKTGLVPKTAFKKGQPPWNKDKFDLNTYCGLHNWVKHQRGKAIKCEVCGRTDFISWANKSNEYKKDLDDWIQLCKKCHYNYDREHFGVKRRIYG